MRTISWLRALGGAALAALVLTGGSAIADAQAIRYYEDAVSRFNSGDSKGALIQLKNSLQRDPTPLQARVLMGQIQLDLGNLLQAEEELVMAGKLGADRALIALPLAKARNRLGRYDEVIENLLPTEYPVAMRADLWAELGKARLASKDRVGAEIAFARALELDPQNEQAKLSLVRDLLAQRKYDEALPLVNELLSHSPDNAEAWFLIASIYHARGDLGGALAHYREAVRLNPDLREASLGEAVALLDSGSAEKAVDVLEELTSAQPRFIKAQYFYAKALKSLGRAEDAAALLDRASEVIKGLVPRDFAADPGGMLLASMITYENAEYETAFLLLSRYLELEQGDLGANKMLARLLVRMHKSAEAQRLLTRLKVNYPNDPELLILLGDVNNNLHDYLAAERYYRFALQMVKSNPALVGRLGLSQLRQGETDTAIGTFAWLANQDPGEVSQFSLFLGGLYLSEGRLGEARALADRLVKHDPGSFAARNLLAAVTVRQGEHAASRGLLEQLLKEDPTYRPAQINLIKLDVIERRYAAASAALGHLLELDPKDEIVLYESARLALAQGDRTTAVGFLERVRELNPRAVKPIIELMNLYLAEGRAADALKAGLALDETVRDDLRVKKALARVQFLRGENVVAASLLVDAGRLAGYNVDELREIARLQTGAGEFDDAEANLRKALAERPGSVAARRDLAGLLAMQQRYGEADAELRVALEPDPEDPVGLALLGDIRDAQGRLDEALSLYRRAQKGAANSSQLVLRLHQTLLKLGRSAEALKTLQAWNTAHPDMPSTMLVEADHLQQLGDADKALALYLRLVELAPNNPVVHNNLANVLMPVDAERALAAASRAHELAPQNAAVIDTLGWMLVQLGDLERGLTHLREAASRNSRSPAIRYHLGAALEEYGNTVEATREMRAALSMGRDFPGRQDAEQRLLRLVGER